MGSNKIDLSPKQKILIIFGVFMIIFMIVSVIYYVNTQNQNTKNRKNDSSDRSMENNYTDPGSGETISDPPNKSKEITTTDKSITYLGFSELLNKGISYNQYEKIKSHFKQYNDEFKLNIKEISMTKSTYKSSFDQKTGERLMEFEVTINRNDKLNAKVAYVGLKTPTLYLYSKTDNSLMFKSYTGGN